MPLKFGEMEWMSFGDFDERADAAQKKAVRLLWDGAPSPRRGLRSYNIGVQRGTLDVEAIRLNATAPAVSEDPCDECAGTGEVDCEDCAGEGGSECDLGYDHDCDECDASGVVSCEGCSNGGKR